MVLQLSIFERWDVLKEFDVTDVGYAVMGCGRTHKELLLFVILTLYHIYWLCL